MKKTFRIVMALCLLLIFSVSVFAGEHLSGADNWQVTFTSGGELKPNFTASGVADSISELQPGDDITLKIKLLNENENDTDWYLSNSVLTTLEESHNAQGGAYTYVLTYSGPDGNKELYNSQTVGGIGSNGLKDATDALEEFLRIGTLKKGEEAAVTLYIELDGETQGNDYQSALADLEMNFAVEVLETEEVVKTGDESNLLPYFIVMAISGAALFGIAIFLVIRRRKDRKEEA